MSTIQEFEEAAAKATQASAQAYTWANGPINTTVPTDSGPVPTIAEFTRANQARADAAIDALGWVLAGDFTAGCTVTDRNQYVLVVGGAGYRWDGVLPKVVTAGSSPTPIATGAWLLVEDFPLRSDLSSQMGYSLVGNNTTLLSLITSKLINQETVKIAAFGDSTTDGFATSGWTANPTSGGNAVGNSNHNLTSPNSWPVKLEQILRLMYRNENIFVFNAGYSGKSLSDGWALANYDAAITDNPFYGTPDITLVAFGLNDVRPDGSQSDTFVEQATLLCEKISSCGTVPVIVSSDPIVRNFNATNAIWNRESALGIDVAKKSFCQKSGVHYLDIFQDTIGWLNNSGDVDSRWFMEQSTDTTGDGTYTTGDDVGLHLRDKGHAFKASAIAKNLYGGVISTSAASVQKVAACDYRVSAFGNYLLTLSSSNGNSSDTHSFAGVNFKVDAYDTNGVHRPTVGQAMLEAWVWCEDPSIDAYYLGLADEGWALSSTIKPNPTSYSLSPKVVIDRIYDGSSHSVVPANSGFGGSSYKHSDVPVNIGKLAVGLNRVRYLSGDHSHYYHGASATSSISLGQVASVTVINNGGGLVPAGVTARLYGGGGTGATCSVTVSGGSITGITVTNQGSGYTSAPQVLIGSGSSGTVFYYGHLMFCKPINNKITAPTEFLEYAHPLSSDVSSEEVEFLNSDRILGGSVSDSRYPGNKVTWSIDATIPLGTGVVLAATRGYGVAGDGAKCTVFGVLVRNTSTTVRIYIVKRKSDGTITNIARTTQFTCTFTSDRWIGKVEVSLPSTITSPPSQTVRVYNGWSPATEATGSPQVINNAGATIPMAGVIGGLYVDAETITAAGVCSLNYMRVIRS